MKMHEFENEISSYRFDFKILFYSETGHKTLAESIVIYITCGQAKYILSLYKLCSTLQLHLLFVFHGFTLFITPRRKKIIIISRCYDHGFTTRGFIEAIIMLLTRFDLRI